MHGADAEQHCQVLAAYKLVRSRAPSPGAQLGLQGKHVLVQRALGAHAHHRHLARLPDAADARHRLLLQCTAGGRVEQVGARGLLQVQARRRRLDCAAQRQQEHSDRRNAAAAALEAVDLLLAVGGPLCGRHVRRREALRHGDAGALQRLRHLGQDRLPGGEHDALEGTGGRVGALPQALRDVLQQPGQLGAVLEDLRGDDRRFGSRCRCRRLPVGCCRAAGGDRLRCSQQGDCAHHLGPALGAPLALLQPGGQAVVAGGVQTGQGQDASAGVPLSRRVQADAAHRVLLALHRQLQQLQPLPGSVQASHHVGDLRRMPAPRAPASRLPRGVDAAVLHLQLQHRRTGSLEHGEEARLGG